VCRRSAGRASRTTGAVDLQGALSLYAANAEAFDDGAIEYYAELAAGLTRAVTMLRGDMREASHSTSRHCVGRRSASAPKMRYSRHGSSWPASCR
jgi:hypothetical protein